MKSNFFSFSSILKKFLVFNLIVFLVLGAFTYLYLNAIKPNLIKNRSNQHSKIINNTSDHINRLNIEFTKESATKFLLDARFLFQNLDRVQLYDLNSNLLADTDTLDLAQDIFVISQNVQETSIDKSDENLNISESPKVAQATTFNTESYIRKYSGGANGLVARSKSIESKIKQNLPKHTHLFTAISGIKPEFLIPVNAAIQKLESWKSAKRPVKFISVCTLIKLKNIHLNLQALSNLSSEVDYEYTIVGEGAEFSKLKELTKKLELT